MRGVIATDNNSLAERLRQVLLGLGIECKSTDCVPLAALQARLDRGHVGVILVPVNAADHSLRAVSDASQRSAVPVLAIGPILDVTLIRDSFEAGARLFLDADQVRDEMFVALEKLRAEGAIHQGIGRTIAVTAAAAGTGVTTVATSVAFALGEHQPRAGVVLAELGGGVPEMALNLDIEPRHSVADLLALWEQMDVTLLRQALVTHPAGVSVLLHRPDTLVTEVPRRESVRQTVALLRTQFSYVVVDLGFGAAPASLEALRLADVAMVVVKLDVPALRLARSYLRRLDEQGVPRNKLLLVANRHGQRRQIDRRKAEELLGVPIAEWVPDDPATINDALNQGLPLLRTSRRAAITRQFDALAARLHNPRGRGWPGGKVA